MATQSEAVNWLNAAVGKYWDFDGVYGKQCVDLFNFYYKYLTGVSPYTRGYGVPGAKDLWNVPTDVFTKLPNTPTLMPQPGDVFIYGSSWGGGYGHVEMVLSVGAGGCTVVGNNMTGDPSKAASTAYRTWAKINSGLIGIMRPKFAGGGDMPIPDQDNYYWRYGQKLAMQVRGRELSRAEFQKYLVGQSDLRAVEILSDDPEADKAQHWQDVGKTAVTDRWDTQIYTLQDQLKAAQAQAAAVLADSNATKAQLQEALAKVTELQNHPIIDQQTVATVQDTNQKLTTIFNYFADRWSTFRDYLTKKG